jgi:methylaspartate mutase epsilon subunit
VSDIPGLDIESRVAATLPPWREVMEYMHKSSKPRAVDVLQHAERLGRPIVQPRCGVGDHAAMMALLRLLEEQARPSMLTITIDSYTRLKQFRTAAQTLGRRPADLNGYPLVTHGWRRGRELNEAVWAPVEVRHGSPDARELFAVALASGLTSFEGGGISYNVPYCKDVPLRHSLEAWRQIDAVCGALGRAGIVIDRELFGTLTAVLIPPSISIAISLIEGYAAGLAGVTCLSIAYPQGGEVHQDVAALRSIRELAARYLPSSVEVFPTLHEFMGVFPRRSEVADALIFFGGLTARLGGATKVINKTNQEAYGIPDPEANAHGIRTTAMASSELLDFIRIDEATVEEEMYWLQREVAELVDPIFESGDLFPAIEDAFRTGRLDVPFSASIHARAMVIPKRDARGAIRYLETGNLPFSRATRRYNDQRLRVDRAAVGKRLVEAITSDIHYFLDADARHAARAEAFRPPTRDGAS